MSAREKSSAQYIGPASSGRPEPPSVVDMVRYQLFAPEYKEGNLSILKASGMFLLGVIFVRSGLGSMLIPAL